jgi:hypothetical protein
MDPRDGREPAQLGEREHEGFADQAVDQQLPPRGVELGDAAMVPLELQVGRREGAHERLDRRERRARDGAHRRDRELLELGALGPGRDAGAEHLGGVGGRGAERVPGDGPGGEAGREPEEAATPEARPQGAVLGAHFAPVSGGGLGTVASSGFARGSAGTGRYASWPLVA